jgi:hypothetical protein
LHNQRARPLCPCHDGEMTLAMSIGSSANRHYEPSVGLHPVGVAVVRGGWPDPLVVWQAIASSHRRSSHCASTKSGRISSSQSSMAAIRTRPAAVDWNSTRTSRSA